jgi:acid stress chaperone HdeB
MRLVVAAAFAVTLLAAPASAQTVDLSSIKCRDFVASGKDTISYLMMWLDGHFTRKQDPMVVDFDKMKSNGAKLAEYCVKNPDQGLMAAADDAMAKRVDAALAPAQPRSTPAVKPVRAHAPRKPMVITPPPAAQVDQRGYFSPWRY